MKRTLIALFAVGFILLSLAQVLADGGYFQHPGYWVRPGQQKAVIFYEDNTETMILTSSFQGNAKDLVWIVPTPSKPEVTKSSDKVFINVAKLAMPKYDRGFGYAKVMSAAKGELQEAGGVVVLESKQVDYYDVNVLLATNTQDLVKWFNEHNYSYPETYSYVIKSYIDKGWYFTAIRISPESQGATEVVRDLKEGNPTPIKMTFLSDKIIFPLKISSVDFPNSDNKKYGPAQNEPIGATRKDKYGNTWAKVSNITNGANWRTDAYNYQGTAWSDWLIDQQPGGINYEEYYYRYSDYVPINLYVIADGKYEADGFYPQYGNWVKKADIKKLGSDDNGVSYIQPKNNKYFLTSLSASYQKSQMDEDLILTKSDNNQKVNAGPEIWQLFLYGLLLGLILFVVWIFSPLGILFIIGILMLFFSSSRIARVFGWIMNITSFIITLIIGIILLIISITSNSLNNYIVLSLLITDAFVLGMIIIFTLLSKLYKRK